MWKAFFKVKVYLWVVLFLMIMVVGTAGTFYIRGFLEGKETDTQVVTVTSTITSLEKIEEVVFLSTGVQRVEQANEPTKIFKKKVPLSQKTVLFGLTYKVKFGIKSPVKIKRKSDTQYIVKVPKFSVIGTEVDETSYKLYDKEGELLSFASKDIDTGNLVVKELSNKKQKEILKDYQDFIKESAENYYQNLFAAINPEIEINVVFTE